MPRVAWLVIASLAACGDDGSSAPPDATAAAVVVPDDLDEPPPPPEPSPFPEGTRSLRLIRSTGVWLAPGTGEGSKRIGTVAQDIRVGWTRTAEAEGCAERWVEITPRGWVCGEYLEPTERAEWGVEMPRLERGEIVPGVYGKVTEDGAMVYAMPEAPKQAAPASDPNASQRASSTPAPVRPLLGAVMVRRYGETTVGGKRYWKISRKNEWLPAKAIEEHEPSTWQGTRLGDDTGLALPIGFVFPKQRYVTKAWVRRDARGRGTLRQVEQRTIVPILETVEEAGKIAHRIGEGEWLMDDTVRIARASEPPAGVGERERWFDIDLDTQILVAYEGRTPVYATLVSTGKKEKATPAGLWRMWKKVSEQDLGNLSGEDPYSVATVPWTQFFDPNEGLALHAAYWHDQFGITKSRGCINLAPADARWLYFWSEPITPPGWTMTAGVVEAPGSVVRVRSAAEPEPAWRGYAQRLVPGSSDHPQP